MGRAEKTSIGRNGRPQAKCRAKCRSMNGHLSFRRRLDLVAGKIRRWCLIRFRPGYVKQSLARRRGACRHCGACCNLALTCPGLRPDHGDGAPGCQIYSIRSKNCRVFPIDERDIEDRDYIMPNYSCGCYFVPEREDAPEDGASTE